MSFFSSFAIIAAIIAAVSVAVVVVIIAAAVRNSKRSTSNNGGDIASVYPSRDMPVYDAAPAQANAGEAHKCPSCGATFKGAVCPYCDTPFSGEDRG